jgi:hypothetical protein
MKINFRQRSCYERPTYFMGSVSALPNLTSPVEPDQSTGPMHFRGYRPNFVTDFDPLPTLNFTTLEELLEMPWVKRFTSGEHFTKLYLSLDKSSVKFGRVPEHTLMVHEKDNRAWVVGFLTGPGVEDLDLPHEK